MKKPEVLNLIKENVGFSNEQTNELYDDVYDIIEYYYYEDDGYYISFTEESIESTLSEREEYKNQNIDWGYVQGLVESVFYNDIQLEEVF